MRFTTLRLLTLPLLLGLALSACGGPGEESTANKPVGTPEQNVAKISTETAAASGIEMAAAGPATIHETLKLYGSIRPNAERTQTLRARYPGIVKSVGKRPGDSVSKGETLLTIQSNESLQTYAIVSPIAGTVLERQANIGETVGSESTLMVVADLTTVWAEFAVFARDLSHVRSGQPVTVSGADNDLKIDTAIRFVSPAGDMDSQSVVARANVDNRDSRWIPGQFVTGDVVTQQTEAAIAVQPGSIQILADKKVVFVKIATGFEPRAVIAGKQSPNAVEIIDGIKPGETYAATNSYLIKAELLKGEAEED